MCGTKSQLREGSAQAPGQAQAQVALRDGGREIEAAVEDAVDQGPDHGRAVDAGGRLAPYRVHRGIEPRDLAVEQDDRDLRPGVGVHERAAAAALAGAGRARRAVALPDHGRNYSGELLVAQRSRPYDRIRRASARASQVESATRRAGRPPGGARPGERVKDYPQVSLRIPPALKSQLYALG